MGLEYIRKQYGVPAFRGMLVEFDKNGMSFFGRITSADGAYIRVQPEAACPITRRMLFHPDSVIYRYVITISDWYGKYQ